MPTLAVADHFRPQVEREAKAHQGTRTDLKHGGKLPPSKVRDRLGELAGLSGRTLEKATAVVRAAPKRNPHLSAEAAGLPGGPVVQ